LVRLAGGPVEAEGARQTPAVVFTIQLASPGPETAGERMAVLRLIRKACDENILGQACSRVSFVPATPGEGTVSLKLGLPAGDLARWNGMTDLEIEARQRVDEICRFLIGEAPAFRGARLCRSATQVGIRTGGRIRGEARLAGSDVLECRRFADGVVQGAWPIEEWRDGARPEMTHLPEGEHYEIPAGCLCVENMENVFAAGRCISASERALASARVMGIALGTGWAAGKLAAFHAAGRPRSEAVEEVRAELAPAPDAT